MLGTKLVRLIERHSEALSRGLTKVICTSDRTSDFREIPGDDLRLAAADVYHQLGEWLLQKTEDDIAQRFRSLGARRASQQIRLPQLVWALTLSRDYLWRFLHREALDDSIVQLHAELELQDLLNHFFDRAIYYAIVGYEERQRSTADDWTRAKAWAVSVGLMPPSEGRAS